MSDNLDRNMQKERKKSVHSGVCMLKDTWYSGRQMSHLFVLTKPALLHSKTSITSESSIDE
jgi:hypothetical protein